jgi:hypothetical protein
MNDWATRRRVLLGLRLALSTDPNGVTLDMGVSRHTARSMDSFPGLDPEVGATSFLNWLWILRPDGFAGYESDNLPPAAWRLEATLREARNMTQPRPERLSRLDAWNNI